MKINMKILTCAISFAIAAAVPTSLLAALELESYGSARLQLESVNPDSGVNYQSGDSGSYIGPRDAYSRIGLKLGWQMTDAVKFFGQLEIPLDIANIKVQDPYNDIRDLRIAKIGLDTDRGTLAFGQMWLPFYNAISYKVDRFSSYYSGYATLAQFRAHNVISYYSPDYDGFSFSAGAVMSDRSDRADTFDDNRYQFTTSYNRNGTDISIGGEHVANDTKEQLFGAALGQQIEQLYVAVKFEHWNENGSEIAKAINFYADYQVNEYTFKAMIADVEGFGGQILHVGADYQFSKNVKTFVEFYQQESASALSNRKAGGAGTPSFADPLQGGGNALAVGFRYDF